MEFSFDNTENITDANDIESKEVKPSVTWQHIWSFNETRDALSESSFAGVPNEILLRIFRLLSVRDLCNISLVCRLFKMVADQDAIWKLKCNSKYSSTSSIVYKY